VAITGGDVGDVEAGEAGEFVREVEGTRWSCFPSQAWDPELTSRRIVLRSRGKAENAAFGGEHKGMLEPRLDLFDGFVPGQ